MKLNDITDSFEIRFQSVVGKKCLSLCQLIKDFDKLIVSLSQGCRIRTFKLWPLNVQIFLKI